MARIGVVGCALLAALMRGAESARVEPKPADPLVARIVPTTFQEKGGRTITLAQPFHVVITNVSERPVRLWREWCSWGYFTLSFVVTVEDGRTVTVSKKTRGWDKNYPDWMEIPPGDHFVVDVSFDESVWQNVPKSTPGKPRIVTMKAVYAIPVDRETERDGVWTGRIASLRESYTLY